MATDKRMYSVVVGFGAKCTVGEDDGDGDDVYA